MSRRNRRSPRNLSPSSTQVSLATEAMELRQVMSATTSSLIPAATKEITVTAKYNLPNPGYRLEIDAVVVKYNTVYVFSTIHPPAPGTLWPQVIKPAEKSLTVTVPNRDLAIEYHYGSLNSPSDQLNNLIHTDGATVAYRNPNATDSTAWPVDESPVATKQITVTAEYLVSTPGYDLEIDAIVAKGNKIHVFSTIYPPAPGTNQLQIIVHARESQAVTVPDIDYDTEYHYGSSGESNTQLFHLLQDSSATAAYLNPESDSSSAWPRDDFEVAPTSPIDLSLRPGGPAPDGIEFTVDAERQTITVWFDERASFTAINSNRHFRQYEITTGTPYNSYWEFATVMDEDPFDLTLPGQPIRQFGGRYEVTRAWYGMPDSLQIRMRELPYFADGATNTNALATEWSESVIHKLPSLQNLNSVSILPRFAVHEGKSKIEWLPVPIAESYEVWVKSVKGDKTIFHRSSIAGTEQVLDWMLAPGDYRVWVRARRFDGSLTKWGLQQVTMETPTIVVTPIQPTGDKTPTIKWNGPAHAGSYIVRIVDEAREKQTESMRFASEADRINYLTAYSATVSGNATEHVVAQALPAGNYRAVVIAQFTNNETAFSSSRLTIESSSLTTPILSLDFSGSGAIQNINPDSTATGYEVWVAYLGREYNPIRSTLDATQGAWNFARTTSLDGRYQIPADAPVGTYRVWMRATKTANPSAVSAWSTPVVLSHGTKVQSTGSMITWNPTRGAAGYQVDIKFGGNAFSNGGSTDDRPNVSITTTSTSWTLPALMDAGTYWVRVTPFFSLASATPLSLVSRGEGRVSHQPENAWSWDVKFQDQKLRWTAVPDAVEYELEVTDSSGSKNVTVIPGSQSDSIGMMFANLPAGVASYTVRLRARRRVNQAEGWTFWTPATAITTVEPPTNIRLNGTVITWDNPNENGPFSIKIRQVNRNLVDPDLVSIIPDVDSDFVVFGVWELSRQPDRMNYDLEHISIWHAPKPVPNLSMFSESNWTTRSIDLKSIFSNLFASRETVEFDVSVKATSGNFASAAATKRISVEVFTADAEPIIERTTYSALPEAPRIQYLFEPVIFQLPNLSLGLSSTKFRNSVSGIQWDVDQEFAVQWQLQLTNLETNVTRVLSESQLGMLFRDLYDDDIAYLGDSSAFVSLQTDVMKALFGTTGLFSLKAKARYLPILQNAGKRRTFAADFTPDDPNEAPRINVTPTPWSEWGEAFEYAVLPDGENVLPWTQNGETFNARPELVWGFPLTGPTTDENFEVWVENATTGERAVHTTIRSPRSYAMFPWTTVSNESIMRFTPESDLPPGTYHWWVRKVGDSGPRNGWSAKQTIEIVKAPVTVTMDVNTVDATPVISWQRISDAESYAVELRSVSSGAIVYSATEAANVVSHRVSTPQSNGDYHVIVRALFAKGGHSAAGKLAANGQLVPIVMTIGARVENISVSQDRIIWQAMARATRYQVFVQFVNSNGSIEKVIDEAAFENSLALPSSATNRPGEYRIWIRAIRNEAGHESTGFWSQRFTHHVPIASLRSLMDEDDFQLTLSVMEELATSAI